MKKIIKEFKDFAMKGNVIDLAVGVIIANSFNAIVSSLVKDVIMPFFGAILGGIDFKVLSFKFGEASINYGLLIQSFIDFFIVAFSLFIVVKFMNKVKERTRKEEKIKDEKKLPDDIILLTEIKELLKDIKENKEDVK